VKFFGKILIFFLGVIALQSLTIFVLVTNIVELQNVEDARVALELEARAVSSNFHRTKQRMWESLVRVKGSTLFQNYRIDSLGFQGLISDLVDSSAVDWVVARDATGTSRVLTQNYAAFPFDAQSMLVPEKQYPHGGFFTYNDNLYYMTTFQTSFSHESDSVDMFMVKHLSADYLRSISRRPDALIFLYLGEQEVAGTGSQLSVEGFGVSEEPRQMWYDRQIGDESWNIAFSIVGEIRAGLSGVPISLGIGLSNRMYSERLWMLRRVLFWVAVSSAMLTGLLALLFSRHISKPVALLLGAMDQLRKGEYQDELPGSSIKEFEDLFTRFKKMARTLDEDRKEMERYIDEIIHLKEFNEVIIESLQSGIVILDGEGRIIRINSFFLNGFIPGKSRKDLDGVYLKNALPEIIDDETDEAVLQVIHRKRKTYTRIRRLQRNRVYEIKVYPLFWDEKAEHEPAAGSTQPVAAVVIDDISKRTEAEEKIYRAEKLSAISLLTAGVAHEINNPLASMLTNVQLLLEDETDEEKRDTLVWFEQETRRIARIVRSLLDFGGSRRDEQMCVDTKKVLESVIQLLTLSFSHSERIRIDRHIESVAPLAISDDELKQIAINILKNSIQAIRAEGTIEVTVTPAWSGGGSSGALFLFRDNGHGMTEEALSRAFDPFFTTKGGEGSGLGLSLVYGLVEQHGGTIDISSTPGEGTEVKVFIPFAGESQDEQA
jgi:PAS domain S-box-containing protein